jgi:hypothetical protein
MHRCHELQQLLQLQLWPCRVYDSRQRCPVGGLLLLLLLQHL